MFGLDFINKLRPGKFKYTKKARGNDKLNFGLKAQDINDVIKYDDYNIVKKAILDGEEFYTVDYLQFLAPLIKAIQELDDKIKVLEGKQNVDS